MLRMADERQGHGDRRRDLVVREERAEFRGLEAAEGQRGELVPSGVAQRAPEDRQNLGEEGAQVEPSSGEEGLLQDSLVRVRECASDVADELVIVEG